MDGFFINNGDDVAYIGRRQTWGGQELFGLRVEDRRQHVYLVGQTGSGKSTVIKNLFLQDVYAGGGAAILDPHGDAAGDLLDCIPPCRADDVIYFNPADLEHPVSFNLLASGPVDRRHLVASGIVTAFKSIWKDSWGPRLEHLLFAAVAALLECQNTTLLGLSRMLVDETYQAWVVRQVKDPVVRAFWADEYAGYDVRFRREIASPILNKVGQLLMSPPVRNILGQVRNRIDMRYIMDHRRIFIANLAKGKIGEDKANLLGALLVTQFQRAAMERADVPEEERADYPLYIDEFHNFSTGAFSTILSESRKHRLCLTLAHQYLDQLADGTAEAIFGNVGTIVSFRVAEKDAAILSRHFGGHYDPSLFSTLDNHRIVAKVLAGGRYGDPFLAETLPALALRYGRGQKLIRRCRERYAMPRRLVEDKIRRWLGTAAAV